MRKWIRWADQKVNHFQQKEMWHYKQNYDKCRRPVALKEVDTVLDHATTFKGWKKIQNQWENREYVVEWWPYPNLSVDVVHPRDGEGCSQTLHRNYLLPISNNLQQVGDDENPVTEVEPIDRPTPVPPADSELLANGLTESQPESLPSSLPKQHKLVDLELTGLAASCIMSDESQAGQGQSAPLRYSAHTIRNQVPWKYWNFILQWNNTLLVPLMYGTVSTLVCALW